MPDRFVSLARDPSVVFADDADRPNPLSRVGARVFAALQRVDVLISEDQRREVHGDKQTTDWQHVHGFIYGER